MTTTELAEARKKARLGINPYTDWVAREGLLVHEGVACDLNQVETRPWPRLGANAAAVHLTGRGDFCNLFAIELPPAASTLPQRHLYEEVFYVVSGRGSTQVEFPDGRRHSFEWQDRSLFALPLNATYRLFNADGAKRALLASTTSLPLMMKLFHNERFIFENDFFFEDRVGKDAHYAGQGDLTMVTEGSNIWETNFVPDLGTLELTAYEARGPGSLNLKFVLGGGHMHGHCSEIQPGTYKKAHWHDAGRHVFTVTGTGYSLLWFPGESEFTRVDWYPGVVFPPIDKQFHQHFVTSHEPSRYLATGVGSIRYPLTDANRQSQGADDGGPGLGLRSIKLGGRQIEYEDQDPRIHALWLEEMARHGVTPQFDTYTKARGRDN